ncbi:catalase-related domain-containing protein [Dyadobacter sp. 3J3]|uniref:catalase-related domain-containing protein n=1 Tax=Dyadobacter sp. 3J3 TaxID=2606600 RepID=UPI00286E03BE|nr:catalase-related domain-containing protein [Dyadobacter sp. 3J3]
MNGLIEAPQKEIDYEPTYVAAKIVRQTIDRTNNYAQAGELYRSFEDWERSELISNFVSALAPIAKFTQDKMIEHFTKCDADYGRRVAEGLRQKAIL